MQVIKIKKILAEKKADISQVAKHIFPKNAFPRLALNRVMKGRGKFNSSQIAKLVSYLDISLEEAYSGEWKSRSTEGVITFSTGEYEARLDTKNWTTKLFHKKSLFHKSVKHDGAVALSEYLCIFNELIINHIKENENNQSRA